MNVFYLNPGSVGLMVKKHTHGDIFCGKSLMLVKKSKLTSCTSFKSTRTSLLSMFESMWLHRAGTASQVDTGLGWLFCSLPLSSREPSRPWLECTLPPSRSGGACDFSNHENLQASSSRQPGLKNVNRHTSPGDSLRPFHSAHPPSIAVLPTETWWSWYGEAVRPKTVDLDSTLAEMLQRSFEEFKSSQKQGWRTSFPGQNSSKVIKKKKKQ